MTRRDAPRHVVVDGSNIATEGRSVPSLAQLNEAVLAMVAQYPEVLITVVVDATFGHRIDKSERAEFDEAIANNELVAPPAGAIGRGDAFVLGIADKAGASVLSNDSFQEFHGSYDWLFDEGRLIGGKPVPHVGWVFVDRVPVRGPVSRQATRSRTTTRVAAAGDDVAETTADAPKASRRRSKKSAAKALPKVPAVPPPGKARTSSTRVPKGAEPVNELIPFLEFAERHQLGSVLEAVIDSYSSHGAYAKVDDVLVYLPLRLMGPTPPNKARDVVGVGQRVSVEVHQFSPARRSIDVGLVGVLDDAAVDAAVDGAADVVSKTAAATRAASNKAASKKSPAKKGSAKKVSAKKGSAKKAPARRAPAKKVAAKKVAAKKAPAKKAPAKRAAANRTPVKNAASKNVSAKRTPVTTPAAKKVTATKRTARSSASPSQ
jgi:hypothetical protein